MTLIRADLTGKTALVTGGASGIGRATAHLLARSGAAVAINGLPDDPQLTTTVDEFSAEGLVVTAVRGDIGDPASAVPIVLDSVHKLGRLDYLINNAATPATNAPIPERDLDAHSDELWSTILGVNLVGSFRCARAAASFLKATRGAIVNVASTAAFGSVGSSMAYGASKAGLVNLTRSLSRGLGPDVRVNAVAPGYIRTPWTERFGSNWQDTSMDGVTLKRAGSPADVAEVILFLCAGAGYVTGQTIVVDGGEL